MGLPTGRGLLPHQLSLKRRRGGLSGRDLSDNLRRQSGQHVDSQQVAGGLDFDGRTEDDESACLPQGQREAAQRVYTAGIAMFRQVMAGDIGRDVLFAIARGNSCTDAVMSASSATFDLANVITVGAADSDSTVASSSNFGPSVEVAAPGGQHIPTGQLVWSTFAGGNNGYGQDAGTSMAAPIVAGVAALVRSAHPGFSAAQVGYCITATAGTTTGNAAARADTHPKLKVDPRIGFSGSLPIVNAEAAVACNAGIDPPTSRGGTDYIARDPDTGRSVHVLGAKVYGIPDGAMFNCLAQTRIVWDIANLKPLLRPYDGIQLTCNNTGRTNWTYTPTAYGGNTGIDVILRNSNGNYWLINSAGEIQTIPDGGTYLCLAASNPVIWNTPDARINDWSPAGNTPAACGGNSRSEGPPYFDRMSVASSGAQSSVEPRLFLRISHDGRYVAFASGDPNL